jgi:hypothetical protein
MTRILKHYTTLVALMLAASLMGCGKHEKESTQESNTSSKQQSTSAKSESPTLASNQSESNPVTPPAPPASPDITEITTQNTEKLKAMNQGKEIEPLSTDTLKGFMPESLAGMKRSTADARQMSMVGINVASAQADYEDTSGSGTVDLMIMDLGNVSGAMRMGMTGWTLAQIDRKTDTGYEKTTTYQGYKTFEEYDNESKHGEFRVFVGERFVVEITGDNVTMETIKQAMSQIDLKKLAQSAK